MANLISAPLPGTERAERAVPPSVSSELTETESERFGVDQPRPIETAGSSAGALATLSSPNPTPSVSAVPSVGGAKTEAAGLASEEIAGLGAPRAQTGSARVATAQIRPGSNAGSGAVTTPSGAPSIVQPSVPTLAAPADAEGVSLPDGGTKTAAPLVTEAPEAATEVASIATQTRPAESGKINAAQPPKSLLPGLDANLSVVVPSGPAPQPTPGVSTASAVRPVPSEALGGLSEQATPQSAQSVVLPRIGEPSAPVLPSPQAVAPTKPAPSTVQDLGDIVVPTGRDGARFETTAAVVPRVSQGLPGQQAGTLTPSGQSGFGDRATGVVIRRPGADASTPEPNGADTNGEPDAEAALVQYAAKFQSTGDKPKLAIVLLDTGTLSFAAEALRNFQQPLSIALAPSRKTAADLMRSYRTEGYEILGLAELAEGARPADIEVAFEAYSIALPEMIGFLDRDNDTLHTQSGARAQLAEILAERGMGLVSSVRGLNPVVAEMTRGDVPAIAAFRDLGSIETDVRAIRRFLDQAAFEAAQRNEGIVVVGQLQPTIISGLLLWGVGRKADGVEIVPVSHLLLNQAGQ